MKKIGVVSIILLLIAGGIYYYFALPAINIHSPGLWTLIISLLVITGLYIISFKNEKKIIKIGYFSVTITVISIFVLGWLLSSEIINASKYSKLINIAERDFSTDIKEVNYTEIPSLDKDSAKKLGLRKWEQWVTLFRNLKLMICTLK